MLPRVHFLVRSPFGAQVSLQPPAAKGESAWLAQSIGNVGKVSPRISSGHRTPEFSRNSLTERGRVSSGWHKQLALLVGRSTKVGDGLSHDSRLKKPVPAPFIPAVFGSVPSSCAHPRTTDEVPSASRANILQEALYADIGPTFPGMRPTRRSWRSSPARASRRVAHGSLLPTEQDDSGAA